MTTQDILTQAAAARRVMAVADTAQKNRALGAMGEALLAHTPQILAANEADLEAARSSIGTVMLDRLALNEGRIQAMAEGMARWPNCRIRWAGSWDGWNGPTAYASGRSACPWVQWPSSMRAGPT